MSQHTRSTLRALLEAPKMPSVSLHRRGLLAALLSGVLLAGVACSTPGGPDAGPDSGTAGDASTDDGGVLPDGGGDNDGGFLPDGGPITTDGGHDGGTCDSQAACPDPHQTRNGACQCVCADGYLTTPDNNACVATSRCDSHAVPGLSRLGQLTCTCMPGYYGDGFIDGTGCTFNACYRAATETTPENQEGPCPVAPEGGDNHASCINTGALGRCVCDPGYVAQNDDGGTLVACLLDECNPTSPCDEHASCAVTSSGHSCTCEGDYTGTGNPGECKRINHCSDTVRYCDTNADCRYDEVNGTSCQCHLDWDGDGRPGNCHLHNYCLDATPHCDEHAACIFRDLDTTTPPPGSFCKCQGGYDGNGSPGHCTPHNYCNDNPAPCDADATCTFTLGVGDGYSCQCPDGMAGDGLRGDGSYRHCHAGYSSFSTGWFGACAIRSDNALFCWGDGSQGAVGNNQINPTNSEGTANHVTCPSQVTVATDWIQVSGGQEHACGIRSAGGSMSSGTLWCWGQNGYGQLGYDTFTPADQNHHPELGYNTGTPHQVGSSANWTKVAASFKNTCALKDDTSLWCWGYDEFGVVLNGVASTDPWLSGTFNNPSTMIPTMVTINGLSGSGTGWIDVVSGNDHVCGLRDDHTLWCWGRNRDGQIGNGRYLDDADGPYEVPAGASLSWDAVTAGDNHTVAIKSDGSLWCWGDNASASCGQGIVSGQPQTPRNAPVEVIQIGSNTSPWQDVSCGPQDDHCCAIKADRTLWCWGYNGRGEAGQPIGGIGYVSIAMPVRDLPAGVQFTEVQAGGGYTCALDTKSRLWCFGSNAYGQLGQCSGDVGNATPTQTQ